MTLPLRPGNDEQIATRMRHVCEAAHVLQHDLGSKPRLCRAIGDPLLDLVVALSVLYADVNVDTSEAELDA